MENYNPTKHRKKQQKFINIDLDLNFQKSEEIENLDIKQHNEDNDCLEEEYELETFLNKGPKKRSITDQNLKEGYNPPNSLFNEIFDQKIQGFYKASTFYELILNSSFKKGIKNITFTNVRLAGICCEFKFNIKWVDYKDGKICTTMCPDCQNYWIIFTNDKSFLTLNGYTYCRPKALSADVIVECNCGQFYVKEGFESGHIFVSKKCNSCGEYLSLLDGSLYYFCITNDSQNFTKNDLCMIFNQYGFCTSDYSEYFKLSVETTDQEYFIYANNLGKGTRKMRKLVIEKIK
jgi:hypothetical protein